MVKPYKDLELWATRPYSTMGNQQYCEYIIEKGGKFVCAVPIGNDRCDYVVDRESFAKSLKNTAAEFIRDHKKIFKDYDLLKNELFNVSSELSMKSGKIPDKELNKLFLKYWGLIKRFRIHFMFPHYIERFLEPQIKEKFPDDFDVISAPTRPVEQTQMEIALLRESPKKVAERFGYLAIYGMTEKPFDEEYFGNYMINEQDLKKNLSEMEKNKDRFNDFIKRVKGKDKVLCTILHEFIFIRSDRMDTWKRYIFLQTGFLEHVGSKISPKLGIREASMLARDEISSVLTGRAHPSAQEMIERGKRESVLTIYTKKGVSFVKDDKLMQEIIDDYRKTSGEITELKGMPSCKGIVRGDVKIYINRSDIKPGESGYIFVARTTIPQDTPIMKRAKAIVTDEGGVTSHAAIVSRELGIPGITGTKIATRVFKDGDYVEVDAEKGIIRKLKR